MKKVFLILTLCCAVALAGCEKDLEGLILNGISEDMELAFPDPYFRKYVLENFDTDKDGKISKEEAEDITKIYAGNKRIESFEGIQSFTNLTYLDCCRNKLTSLDVSKNTKLTELYCDSNQLTSLDVSGCPSLKWLTCYNNQLTSLDISECMALERLRCDYNRLISLDVSKNTQLIELYCSNNQLTTLDVNKNTQLTALNCSSNQLKTLDVSKTNIGNSSSYYPLICGDMSTLETLYLKTEWDYINGITDYRQSAYIPSQTKIIFVD